MSHRAFKRSKLSTLLGLATAALLMTTASVHSQTAAETSKADTQSGKVSSAQANTQGGASGSGAQGSGATGNGDATASSGSSPASGKVSKSDRDMMQKITQANLAEIETAKLAQEKSKNDDVRSFAQKMIDDHTKAQRELEKIAQSKGVSLPSKPDAKHQAAAKKLSALSEPEFNKQYMAQAGLSDHRNAQRLLERASKQAGDADLKQYAAKTVKDVNHHLNMAKEMKVGQDAARSTGGAGSNTGSSGTDDGKSGSSATK